MFNKLNFTGVHIIPLVVHPLKINMDRCTGCGSCIDVCPMDAISLADGKAVIDLDKCANCHACESVCPVDAIY